MTTSDPKEVSTSTGEASGKDSEGQRKKDRKGRKKSEREKGEKKRVG